MKLKEMYTLKEKALTPLGLKYKDGRVSLHEIYKCDLTSIKDIKMHMYKNSRRINCYRILALKHRSFYDTISLDDKRED